MNRTFTQLVLSIASIAMLTACHTTDNAQSIPNDDPDIQWIREHSFLNYGWSMFQLGPWLFSPETSIYGINTGVMSVVNRPSYGLFMPILACASYETCGGIMSSLLVSSGEGSYFSGMSLSLIHMINFINREEFKSNGLMIDVLDFGRHNNGVTLSLINGGGCKNGIEITGVNVYGTQMNGLHISLCSSLPENRHYKMNGVQIALFGAAHLNGIALGVVNPNGIHCEAQLTQALSLGVVNMGAQDGVQIGVFNCNEHGNIFQLGLLNYNKNSYIPWFPFINLSL